VAASLCRGVAAKSTTGPASLMLIDPDGNPVPFADSEPRRQFKLVVEENDEIVLS
jgi:hypothetical protein